MVPERPAMESVMTYPLFDSGYTLWTADLDARLKDQLGLSIRALGVDPNLLRQSYYGGGSLAEALSLISARYGVEMA